MGGSFGLGRVEDVDREESMVQSADAVGAFGDWECLTRLDDQGGGGGGSFCL